VLALDRALQVAQPGSLPVALLPGRDGVAQLVQLDAALALPAPHVRQRAAELGVPEQRRQVVQRDHHPDVVDRAVRDGLDRAVGQRAPAEQPDVAGPRRGDGLVERQ
jgi:hypothetical protein